MRNVTGALDARGDAVAAMKMEIRDARRRSERVGSQGRAGRCAAREARVILRPLPAHSLRHVRRNSRRRLLPRLPAARGRRRHQRLEDRGGFARSITKPRRVLCGDAAGSRRRPDFATRERRETSHHEESPRRFSHPGRRGARRADALAVMTEIEMRSEIRMQCPRCDAIFEPRKPWQRFCSTKCNMQHWNATHAASQAAKARAKRAARHAVSAASAPAEIHRGGVKGMGEAAIERHAPASRASATVKGVGGE